ncbi:MAG: hypothetical protein HQL49_06625 [Gammaproteobacteria bacterium]|nr:hypothetical protein [Gammaproteobacteria bacterium]
MGGDPLNTTQPELEQLIADRRQNQPIPMSLRRWLISFDPHGKECATSISMNESLIDLDEQLPKLIRDESQLFSIQWLLDVLHACSEKLQRRMAQ